MSDPLAEIRARVAAWGRDDDRALLAEVDRLQAENTRLRAVAEAAQALYAYHVTVQPWPGQDFSYPAPLTGLWAALAKVDTAGGG